MKYITKPKFTRMQDLFEFEVTGVGAYLCLCSKRGGNHLDFGLEGSDSVPLRNCWFVDEDDLDFCNSDAGTNVPIEAIDEINQIVKSIFQNSFVEFCNENTFQPTKQDKI